MDREIHEVAANQQYWDVEAAIVSERGKSKKSVEHKFLVLAPANPRPLPHYATSGQRVQRAATSVAKHSLSATTMIV